MTILFRKCVLWFVGALFASSLIAQEEALSGPYTREDVEVPIEQRLYQAARDPNMDFDGIYAEALESGMTETQLLVPQLVNALSTRNFDLAEGLFPKLDAAEESLTSGEMQSFSTKSQFQGFVEISKAIVAFQKDDLEAFEAHAVVGFVKAPELISAFGVDQMMMQIRQSEAQAEMMRSMSVPMDMIVSNAVGESKALSEWLGDDKALLIDFWASWCGPCIRLMPALKEKSDQLGAQGIAVVAMNTDVADGQAETASKVQEAQGMSGVTWLLDNGGGELSGMLQIDSIPRMVLISPEGKILYNGHPQDPSLGDALAKLGVRLSTEG